MTLLWGLLFTVLMFLAMGHISMIREHFEAGENWSCGGLKLRAVGAAVLIFLAYLVPSPSYADTHPAEQVIRNATTSVMHSVSVPNVEYRTVIEAHILPILDTRTMTRLAVGKNWKQFSNGQQEQMVDLFTELMIRTYSVALKYDEEPKIKFGRSTDRGKHRATVRMSITQPGQPLVDISYSMRDKGGWKVYDVVVEGISIVSNYRSTFTAVFKNSGAEGLIQLLRDKVKNG